MIAVWIVGLAFLIVGTLYFLPRLLKLCCCKAKTTGKIVATGVYHSTGDRPIKAWYTYTVDGTEYKGKTGWTQYAIFSGEQKYEVRYNPKNPKRSYIKKSGIVINCAIGIFFAIVGIVVLILGAYMVVVLGL